MVTVQCFAQHLGLSRSVARQLSLCRHNSSCRLYQHLCESYRHSCSVRGHSCSAPSVTKIADFPVVFACGLASVYCSYLWIPLDPFSVFSSACLVLRLTSSSGISFTPSCWSIFFAWFLLLRVVTVNMLFLLSLATAKHMGELQAFSFRVAFQDGGISLSYFLDFITKTGSERTPIPRLFVVWWLSHFIGDLPEDRFPCALCARLTSVWPSRHPPRLLLALCCVTMAFPSFVIYILLVVLHASGNHSR